MPPEDEYYQLLLLIRDFVRYVLMHKLSKVQVQDMDDVLLRLMELRMKLTRIEEPNRKKGKSNYLPALRWKVTFLFLVTGVNVKLKSFSFILPMLASSRRF